MKSGESETIISGSLDYLVNPAVQIYIAARSRGATSVTPRKALTEALKLWRFRDQLEKMSVIGRLVIDKVPLDDIRNNRDELLATIPTLYEKLVATEEGRQLLDDLENLVVLKIESNIQVLQIFLSSVDQQG